MEELGVKEEDPGVNVEGPGVAAAISRSRSLRRKRIAVLGPGKRKDNRKAHDQSEKKANWKAQCRLRSTAEPSNNASASEEK